MNTGKIDRGLSLFAFVMAATLVSCSQEKKEEKPAQETAMPVVKAQSLRLKTETELPGSFEAYQDVPIHAKVQGFISWIGVDRGSYVKKGQKLIVVTAPEVDAKIRESLSKVKAAEATYHQAESALASAVSRQTEVKAKLDADQFTYSRLKQAYDMYAPAVAKNDVDVTGKAVDADRARVAAFDSEIKAAQNLMASEKENIAAAKNLNEALKSMGTYLEINAPFDGVISERNVHAGSIVAVDADRTGRVKPLLRIQQLDPLRLVVAVPEDYVPGVRVGEQIPFTVPAYPGRLFQGTVARPAYALERRTRTMPTELNYNNPKFTVSPGMYATIKWPVTRPYDTVFVPQTAVKTNLKESFVDKIVNDKVEKVRVVVGQTMGELIEITKGLKAGDEVALKANDELETGTRVATKPASKKDLEELEKSGESSGGD